MIKVSGFIETAFLLLRFSPNEPNVAVYWHASNVGGSMDYGINRLGPSRPNAYIFSRNATTSHYLSLWLVDPSAEIVLSFYDGDDAYHGAFAFIDYNFDGNMELLISYATDDRRYSQCNQCPFRRRAEIWGISSGLSEADLLGEHVSWGDLSKNPSVKQPSWSVWPARAPVFWGRVTALLIRRWRDTWTELARASARDDARVSSDVSNFRQFLFQTRCSIFVWDGTPAR